MKMKQFLKSNIFQDIFLSKDEKDLKYFLDNQLLFAIMAKIQEGYHLNDKQTKLYFSALKESINSLDRLEEYLEFNLDNKVVYEIIYHHLTDKINSQNINQYKNIKNWLINKSNEEISNAFFEILMEKTKELHKTKDNDNEIKEYIELFHKNNKHLNELEKENVNLLIGEINKLIQKGIERTYEFKEIIEILSNKNITLKDLSISDIHKELNAKKELMVLEKLKEIDNFYFKIIGESIESNYKESLKNLYDKYLINNIKNYLNINPNKKEGIIKQKAQDMLLGNMDEILVTYRDVLSNIDEQKLNNLSGKKEYLKQVRKW